MINYRYTQITLRTYERMMLNLVVLVVGKFLFIHRCIYMDIIISIHVIIIALAYIFMIINNNILIR